MGLLISGIKVRGRPRREAPLEKNERADERILCINTYINTYIYIYTREEGEFINKKTWDEESRWVFFFLWVMNSGERCIYI